MPDEQSEKIIKVLEEIRDLTQERNAKTEALLESSRQRLDDAKKRYEEALTRQKAAQVRVAARRRQSLWILVPLLLAAVGLLAYIAFWVIPQSEQKEEERWMMQMQMIKMNQTPQLH